MSGGAGTRSCVSGLSTPDVFASVRALIVPGPIERQAVRVTTEGQDVEQPAAPPVGDGEHSGPSGQEREATAPQTPESALAESLITLRDAVEATRFAVKVPGADEATRSARALVDQLDDYVLPRLKQLDAPLLAVVGGSTGAGKSTLVNSLVRTVVSPAGVLRPTTRSPVLVCHPDDAAWFSESHVLPGLSRTTGATGNHQTLHLAPSQALTAGLAFLDAPDIDSVVEANRELAQQLLAAADLWLFVTTAARYADAVPWDLLNVAQERGTALAMVLNRVPPGVEHEVSGHLREMLRDHGVKDPTLFVLPETTLEAGLLPEPIIGPLQVWFTGLAASAEQRAAVVRQTLDGALTSVWPRASELADASDDQATAVEELRASARAAYAAAVSHVSTGISDGALLRGEMLARWQEFVGTGDLLRALENRVGRLRDRLTAAISGRPPRASQLKVALESGVTQLITVRRRAGRRRCCQRRGARVRLASRCSTPPRATSVATLPHWPARSSGSSVTGRARCWRWSAPKAPRSAPLPGSARTASTRRAWS